MQLHYDFYFSDEKTEEEKDAERRFWKLMKKRISNAAEFITKLPDMPDNIVAKAKECQNKSTSVICQNT
jgi:hypothetical protein